MSEDLKSGNKIRKTITLIVVIILISIIFLFVNILSSKPTLEVTDIVVAENAEIAKIKINLKANDNFLYNLKKLFFSNKVSFDYETVNASAVDGNDYTKIKESIVFEGNKIIEIPIYNNDIYEGLEEFYLNISNVKGAFVDYGQNDYLATKISINDDDDKPTLSLSKINLMEGKDDCEILIDKYWSKERDPKLTIENFDELQKLFEVKMFKGCKDNDKLIFAKLIPHNNKENNGDKENIELKIKGENIDLSANQNLTLIDDDYLPKYSFEKTEYNYKEGDRLKIGISVSYDYSEKYKKYYSDGNYPKHNSYSPTINKSDLEKLDDKIFYNFHLPINNVYNVPRTKTLTLDSSEKYLLGTKETKISIIDSLLEPTVKIQLENNNTISADEGKSIEFVIYQTAIQNAEKIVNVELLGENNLDKNDIKLSKTTYKFSKGEKEKTVFIDTFIDDDNKSEQFKLKLTSGDKEIGIVTCNIKDNTAEYKGFVNYDNTSLKGNKFEVKEGKEGDRIHYEFKILFDKKVLPNHKPIFSEKTVFKSKNLISPNNYNMNINLHKGLRTQKDYYTLNLWVIGNEKFEDDKSISLEFNNNSNRKEQYTFVIKNDDEKRVDKKNKPIKITFDNE